jgi:hypothetical protein
VQWCQMMPYDGQLPNELAANFFPKIELGKLG